MRGSLIDALAWVMPSVDNLQQHWQKHPLQQEWQQGQGGAGATAAVLCVASLYRLVGESVNSDVPDRIKCFSCIVIFGRVVSPSYPVVDAADGRMADGVTSESYCRHGKQASETQPRRSRFAHWKNILHKSADQTVVQRVHGMLIHFFGLEY